MRTDGASPTKRAAGVSALALLAACTCGAATASADAVTGAVTTTAAAVARPALGHSNHRTRPPGKTASVTSTNWAGYVAAGAGPYTSVSASWTEPTVTCNTNGIVAFWVGLDGYGSSTVEQDGTGVDCTHGSPQAFAWWETYPANAIQQYRDPVSPGDHLSSTVTSEPGGLYDLVLTDSTRGWTERQQAHLAGANDASAEIVAEAVSTDRGITALPDFHTLGFTGARIDGASLQAVGAMPVDMTDSSGSSVIAVTQPADSAGDFQVRYTGSQL